MEEHKAEPRIEYARRGEERRAEAARQLQRFHKVGLLRLALLVIGLVLAGLAVKGLVAWWWLLLPATFFFALADTQQRITHSGRRCERAAALYDQGLARLDDRWAGTGQTGERFINSSHPYAEDLDLFGRASLFELLSRARTRVGEETLAHWLLEPATPEVVRDRQAAIVELRPRLDLREDLALLGEGVRSGEDARALVEWAAGAPWLISRFTRVAARLLALVATATLILWIAGFGVIPFLLALILGRIFAFRLQTQVNQVISAVDGAARDLSLLSEVLNRLERERFTSPRLVELRAALDVAGIPPSRQIARLNVLLDLLDARRNMIFAPLAIILIWPLQLAISIESWRQTSGPSLPAGWRRWVSWKLSALWPVMHTSIRLILSQKWWRAQPSLRVKG
jgi:hypothetical protein